MHKDKSVLPGGGGAGTCILTVMEGVDGVYHELQEAVPELGPGVVVVVVVLVVGLGGRRLRRRLRRRARRHAAARLRPDARLARRRHRAVLEEGGLWCFFCFGNFGNLKFESCAGRKCTVGNVLAPPPKLS